MATGGKNELKEVSAGGGGGDGGDKSQTAECTSYLKKIMDKDFPFTRISPNLTLHVDHIINIGKEQPIYRFVLMMAKQRMIPSFRLN